MANGVFSDTEHSKLDREEPLSRQSARPRGERHQGQPLNATTWRPRRTIWPSEPFMAASIVRDAAGVSAPQTRKPHLVFPRVPVQLGERLLNTTGCPVLQARERMSVARTWDGGLVAWQSSCMD